MEVTTIGERIKYRRSELRLTLRELSSKCGLSPQLISDYENNRKEPGVRNIKALCGALGIKSDYLLDETFDPKHSKLKTYGQALSMYLGALELSKKDTLEIDRDNKTVTINIEDETLKNIFIQMKDFLAVDGEIGKTIKNFNINLLSEIEIE